MIGSIPWWFIVGVVTTLLYTIHIVRPCFSIVGNVRLLARMLGDVGAMVLMLLHISSASCQAAVGLNSSGWLVSHET